VFAMATDFSSPDCANAMTQYAMNECAATQLKVADARLNDVYAQLMGKMSDAKQKGLLRDAERAWISYRDKECEFATVGTVGGSVHPMMLSLCLAEKTAARTAELHRQLACEEGDLSCAR